LEVERPCWFCPNFLGQKNFVQILLKFFHCSSLYIKMTLVHLQTFVLLQIFTTLVTAICESPPPSTSATSISTTSTSTVDLTIGITNSYGSPVSLSFGLDQGYPTPLGDPQPTVLPDSSTTQYIYPTGWAGMISIGQTLNVNNSLIEASYTNGPYMDISYVDGFSVPITCSSEGVPVIGCNIDLFNQTGRICKDQVGAVCLNSARTMPDGPAPCFFAACAGAAYTFPNDNNASKNTSTSVACCIGTSCPVPLRQLGETGSTC
jgi:hypothetical protein